VLERSEYTPHSTPLIPRKLRTVLLGEPPRTAYDLNFSLFGIPVRVHPMFWLFSVILGLRASDGDPTLILIWVSAVFISILVHEFGHAFAIRYYGSRPWVVLYAMGGLAGREQDFGSFSSSSRARDDTWSQVLISAAGPAAGFALAALVCLTVNGMGARVGFTFGGTGLVSWQFDGIEQFHTLVLVDDLMFINIFWGLLNLLPVYPLDGGQISRELMLRYSDDGIRRSLWLSVFTGAGLAAYGFLQMNSLFMALMFGMLAYSSYQTLQGYTGGGFGRRPW